MEMSGLSFIDRGGVKALGAAPRPVPGCVGAAAAAAR